MFGFNIYVSMLASIATWAAVSALVTVNISVNFQSPIGIKLFHFWESTGLCPSEPYRNVSQFLLAPDMAFNFLYIGALPRQGMMQVRIHWLLNLISTESNFNELSPRYNFTALDRIIEQLWENGLKPGFELMGNPSNSFDDFENRTQLVRWKRLVTETAKRYIAKYGLDYVRQWNFESWNEPDHHDFDGLKISLQGFLNYYDACSEGLTAAHPTLRLGGPAESFFKPQFDASYSWQLLQHCANGTNYFTGERGVRIDFISMHEKGNNSARSILDKEQRIISEIRSLLPTLSTVTIYNDEADPLVGWNRSATWRADVTYAAIIAKVIIQHQESMLAGNKQSEYLLSNDNGFVNVPPTYFEQRTLMTKFDYSDPGGRVVQMVRKPAYILTGMLSYLPSEQVDVDITGEGQNSTDFISGLAAFHRANKTNLRESWNAALLVVNSNDMTSSPSDVTSLSIKLEGVMSTYNATHKTKIRCVCYKMDNNITNPYGVWKNQGEPSNPDQTQLNAMRLQEGPRRLSKPKPWPNDPNEVNEGLTLTSLLNQPGILLVHVCEQPKKAPGPITSVKVHNVTCNDVLITWAIRKVITKCILTYEIQFSSSSRTKYSRINNKDTVFASFQYSPKSSTNRSHCDDGNVRGYYRIRAIDYWYRAGRWTTPVSYGL